MSRTRAGSVAGVALVATLVFGCNPSRDGSDGIESTGTLVTVVIEISPTAPATAMSDGTAEPAGIGFPFTDFFNADQLGAEPVRGSGCGVEELIGDELPDGLWRGFVRSFDGLWVDASTSLDFDLACVYIGDAAIVARQRWVAEHPGEQPLRVPDGFMVNNNDRVRVVPLAANFVQVDAERTDAGGCAPPETLMPSGSTERYRLLDSWLLVENGEARWVLTGCP